MRNVNNARFYEEQNILSVQDGYSIYYVSMKVTFFGLVLKVKVYHTEMHC